MELNETKLIKILDPQAGKIEETTLSPALADGGSQTFGFMESFGRSRPQTLLEVAENNTSVFPSILRDGLRAILFESYAGVPQTWPLWAESGSSDKMQEDYLEESGVGLLPPVGENDPYPHIVRNLDRTVQISHSKRGGIIDVTEEMVFFNRVGVLRQQPAMLGRAMAMTKEQDAYNVLTTTGNYTRNSTTGDNDIGANQADVQFAGAGLEQAISTLVTMKDRHSGMYLGVSPNTLICGPRLQFAAKQLLLSPAVDGVGDTSAVIQYGTGSSNPFRGVVDQIIVSPFIASYTWCLMERGKAVRYNSVWPLQLLQSSMTADNPSYLGFDTISYRAREYYGFGMLNDRFAFFSTDTDGPTVN